MPSVLIVSPTDLRVELGRTILWRHDISRAFVSDVSSALQESHSSPPNLIVVDGAITDAAAAIRRLRTADGTRHIAIAALTRDGATEAEGLRSAGANVVVPAGADPTLWDAPLEDLLMVPRRREARIPVRLQTWSRIADGGDVMEGSALNISVNGLLFESERPLGIGAKLDMRFRLPGHDAELHALGEVVRQDHRPRSGIRFLVLRGEAREAIRAFVESGQASITAAIREANASPGSAAEGAEWELALRASEVLKAAILESAPDAVLIMNHEGRIVEVNEAVEHMLGYDRSAIVGKTIGETIAPPSERAPPGHALADHLASGEGPLLRRRVDLCVRRADGTDMAVELTLVRTHVKGRTFFTAYLRDVADAKRAERAQAALYRISDASSAIGDIHGLYAAIHKIMGEFLYARNFHIAVRDAPEAPLTFPYFVDERDAGPPSPDGARTLTDYVLRTGEPVLATTSVFAELVARGEVDGVAGSSVQWLGVPLKTHDAAVGVLAVQSYDPAISFSQADKELLTLVSHQVAAVLERKRAEARIEHLAYHDQLTGLPNRRLLVDRLELAVAQAQRDSGQVSVFVIDLDGFKGINDSLGHAVGDQVLQALALRLKIHIRKGDTLARIGGDEFAAIVRGARQPSDTAKVAEILQAALREPLDVDENELFITACIGISTFPSDGKDVQTLLGNAHTAVHWAKELARDTFRLYQGSMHSEAVQRLRLESDLRRALSRGEFTVHYQPIIDLATGKIHGMEALLRWLHPVLGMIPPSQFIPVAERIGLLTSIGPWVLRTACGHAVDWQKAGYPVSVAVNVSTRQLQHITLVDDVRRALDDSGLHGSRLELEITESSAMQNPEATTEVLTAVRALGVRISMDDFGTGYSSLSQLQRLRVDTLKIDQSFVRDITTDAGDAAIVTAVTTLAHSLGLQVVAEGVETDEQLAFLAERRCDRVQGYLMSRPVPADRCIALLSTDDAGSPIQRNRKSGH